MTTYSAIASTEIDADSPITDALLGKLRDNPIAISEGASGAPKVMAAALNTATNTLSGTLAAGATVEVTIGPYAFFPSCNGATLSFSLGWTGGTSDDGTVRIFNGTGSPVGYAVRWRAIS